MKKTSLLLILILNLTSCWNNESEWEKIIGNYEVGWNDLVANRSICLRDSINPSSSIPLTQGYVYAVGNNSDFIIAKQHSNLNDISRTEYIIIDLKTKAYQNIPKVFGPMTESEFQKKMFELNISELEFDKLYPENPYERTN
jgi:hypothetical protein